MEEKPVKKIVKRAIIGGAIVGAAAGAVNCADPVDVADMKIHEEKAAHAAAGEEDDLLIEEIQTRDAGLTDAHGATSADGNPADSGLEDAAPVDVQVVDAVREGQGRVFLFLPQQHAEGELIIRTTGDEPVEFNLENDGNTAAFWLLKGREERLILDSEKEGRLRCNFFTRFEAVGFPLDFEMGAIDFVATEEGQGLD